MTQRHNLVLFKHWDHGLESHLDCRY